MPNRDAHIPRLRSEPGAHLNTKVAGGKDPAGGVGQGNPSPLSLRWLSHH
jgi:hypothetical protein